MQVNIPYMDAMGVSMPKIPRENNFGHGIFGAF